MRAGNARRHRARHFAYGARGREPAARGRRRRRARREEAARRAEGEVGRRRRKEAKSNRPEPLDAPRPSRGGGGDESAGPSSSRADPGETVTASLLPLLSLPSGRSWARPSECAGGGGAEERGVCQGWRAGPRELLVLPADSFSSRSGGGRLLLLQR
jgi:hypothetical protein